MTDKLRQAIEKARRHRYRRLRCVGRSPQCLHTNNPDDYPHPLVEWICWGCWLWQHPVPRTKKERRFLT